MSSKSINTLTIKEWHGANSITLDVTEGYSIASSSVGGKQSNKLTVNRQSDKHSTRIGLFAYLRRNQPGYQTLGFPEITLAVEKYDAGGQFLSRTVIIFAPVAVDSLTPHKTDESIVFAFGSMTEMTVSKNGVIFN